MVARFQGRAVFCADVEATAQLYERCLGFSREEAIDGDISLRAPVAGHPDASIQILLHHRTGQPADYLGVFEVDDVDEAAARLSAAGCAITTEPSDAPWGVREAVIADSDGNGFTLVGPLRAPGPR